MGFSDTDNAVVVAGEIKNLLVPNDDWRRQSSGERGSEGCKMALGIAVEFEFELLPGEQLQSAGEATSMSPRGTAPLLLAAIVCWNTVHLQACIKKLRAEGVEVKDEDLRFLSPLLRHHIGIYGQYSLG